MGGGLSYPWSNLVEKTYKSCQKHKPLLLSAGRYMSVVQFITIFRVKLVHSSNHIKHNRKFRLVQYYLTCRHSTQLLFPPNVFF